MRTAEKKLIERNLDLIFEFEKYVLEHPEITEKIRKKVEAKAVKDGGLALSVSPTNGAATTAAPAPAGLPKASAAVADEGDDEEATKGHGSAATQQHGKDHARDKVARPQGVRGHLKKGD